MMGGGMMGYPVEATTTVTNTAAYGYPYAGWEMHGMTGYGMHGMMGGNMMGWWMMGDWPGMAGCHNTLAVSPITSEQALAAAKTAIAAYGSSDLELAEMMQFTNNFYVLVRERSSERDAFELLVDRYTGAVYPEPGPNMMWNTKYGHMGGMMGNRQNAAPAEAMPIAPETAHSLAQNFLDQYASGTVVEDGIDTFYGYYTIETLHNGQITGMLSVNGYTGQVWIHTWHGNFIGTVDNID
jgi:hypothetical protein